MGLGNSKQLNDSSSDVSNDMSYWQKEIEPVLRPMVKDLIREKEENPNMWLHRRLLMDYGVDSVTNKKKYTLSLIQARNQLSDNGIRLQELANEIHSITQQIDMLKSQEHFFSTDSSQNKVTLSQEQLVKELSRKLNYASELSNKVNKLLQLHASVHQRNFVEDNEQVSELLSKELLSPHGVRVPPSPLNAGKGSVIISSNNPGSHLHVKGGSDNL